MTKKQLQEALKHLNIASTLILGVVSNTTTAINSGGFDNPVWLKFT